MIGTRKNITTHPYSPEDWGMGMIKVIKVFKADSQEHHSTSGSVVMSGRKSDPEVHRAGDADMISTPF